MSDQLPEPIRLSLRSRLQAVRDAAATVDAAKETLKAAQKTLMEAQADLNTTVDELTTAPRLPFPDTEHATLHIDADTGEILNPTEPQP